MGFARCGWRRHCVRRLDLLPGALQNERRRRASVPGPVTLTDTSHDGEQVTVDGDAIPVTIDGQRAQLSINNAEPGSHTLELTDPFGCFPSMVTECD